MTRATRPPGPLRVNRSSRTESAPKAARHPLPAIKTVRLAPLANRLGDPVKADLKHQCMSCQRWMSCRDPAKAFGYRCSRWQELVTLDTGELFSDAMENPSTRDEEPLITPDMIVSNLEDRKQESTLEKLLDEALAAGLDMPPDLRVDDRDVPAPYNYDQWVTGRNFSGMTTDLFPSQHKILAEFNSEICPRCSDLKFLDTMRVDTDLGEYRDRVVLLQNGKCPKCGVTKSELFVNGEINDYLSLFGIAGQRCLVGESLVLTSAGPKRIDEFGDAAKSGWSPVTLTDSSGDPIKIMTPGGNLVDPVAFFVGEPVRLVLVTLDDGSTVAGSEEHPIMTAHGWRRLPEIRSGDVVPVFYPEWLERRVASVEVTETRGPVYDIHVPDHNSYLLANGVWSHNSGKTAVINVNEGYQTARWVKLPSPQRVFKVLDQQLLVATYVALTLGQVRQNMWDPFVESITRSPFFRNLHALLDHYGAKYGEELYSVKDIFIRYRHRGLLLVPSGPNKRTMRGSSRYCFAGDTFVNSDAGTLRIADPSLEDTAVWGVGRSLPVAAHLSQGVRRVVKMTNSLNTVTTVTPDHHFVVWSSDVLRFRKMPLNKIDPNVDYLVIQLGGEFPAEEPDLPPFDASTFEGYRPRLDQQVVDRMKELGSFTYHDFQDLCPNRNLFYVYSSALRRAGLMTTTFLSKASVAGQPRSVMEVSEESFDELDEWVTSRIKDASFGSRRRNHVFPTQMSPDLALLLGCMISDGKFCYEQNEFTFASTTPAYIREFSQTYERVFQSPVRVNGPYTSSQGNRLPYWEARMAYASVKSFFRGLGLVEGDWSLHHEVPPLIFRSTESSVRAFVRGLWIGDGFKNGKGYCSIAPKLIRELQQLLFKLGVVTRITRSPQVLNDMYNLNAVSAFDIGKIRGIVGGDVVDTKYREVAPSKRLHGSYNHYAPPGLDVLDNGTDGGSTIEKVWLDSRMDKTSERKRLFALRNLYERDPATAAHVSKFIDKGLALARLKSVEDAGYAPVYDLSIDDRAHVFTANGMLVSNSSLVDELGWFPFGRENEDKTKMSAEEVLKALENSLATLQAKYEFLMRSGNHTIPKPQLSCISSPSEINDAIMVRHRKSIGSTISYTFKRPTWEMNPELPRDCSFLKNKFQMDEEGAMRDFGCEPPMSSAAWIREIANAEGAFIKSANSIVVRQIRLKSPSGQRQSSGRVEFRTRANGGRLLALDSGYVNNSFSFAILRLDDGMPVVEGLGEIIPSYDAPINFPDLTHRILIPIVQNCGVQFVVSDRWQSLATLQTIEAQCGTPWENLRCVYEDFNVLREHIFDQTISLPKLEIPAKEVIEPKEDYPKCFMGKPVSHLLWQMFTVRDYPGKTVEKGGDSTDDLFRAVVLGVKALAVPEIAFILQEEPQVQERRIWGSTASLSSGTGKAVTTLGVAGGRGTGVGGSSYTGSAGSTGSKR